MNYKMRIYVSSEKPRIQMCSTTKCHAFRTNIDRSLLGKTDVQILTI